MWNINHTFKDFDRFFVGFDPIVKKLTEATEQASKLATEAKYPPYNIRKIDDTHYTIEMAVAGFGRQDIDIELDGDKLIIKGNSSNTEGEKADDFLFRGLSNRPFTRQFTLADNVEISGATIFNGILKIALDMIIPESTKPKKIDIVEKKGN